MSDIAYVLLVGDVTDNWGQIQFDYNTQVPMPYWLPGLKYFWEDTTEDEENPPLYYRPSDTCYAYLDSGLPPAMSYPPSQQWVDWWNSYDIYPDLYVGRLTADNIQQVNVMVNKLNTYERHLDTTSNLDIHPWYDTMLFVAHWESRLELGKKKVGHDVYDIELPYIIGCWGSDPDNTNETVMNYINQGCNIVNYYGHGSPNHWLNWATRYDRWGLRSFQSEPHIINLNNDHYVVSFNIGCRMALIDWWQGDTLCDYWMRLPLGQLPPYHGAVAAIGATRGGWDPDGAIYDKALFQTMYGIRNDVYTYDKPLNIVGAVHYGAILRAFLTMDEYDYKKWILHSTFIHILLGEPSMEIRNKWTDGPSKNIVKCDNFNMSNKIEIKYIYPNPSSGVFKICYRINNQSPIDINVYDIAGRLIKNIKIPTTNTYNEELNNCIYEGESNVDLTELKDGLYILNINNEVQKRLIICK
jgi:hypothetical protein